MDQVKQYLALARKHHFWILCAIAAIAALIVWRSSTSKLDAGFKAESEHISKTLLDLRGINAPHANETWTEGITQTTNATKQDVKEAWEKLYKAQKETVCIWPERLGKDFIEAVNKPQPLRSDFRIRYQDKVKHEAPHLAEIVDAGLPDELNNRGVGGVGMGGLEGGGGPQEAEVPQHRIKWDDLAEILNWFDWFEPPTTQTVKHAQEELWVYEALCNVIKRVNEGSTGAHDAPITEIQRMAIAYAADIDPAKTTGRIKSSKPAVVMTEANSAPAPMAGGEGGGGARPNPAQDRLKGEQHGPRGEGETAADPDERWRSYRYVNDEGKPMMGAEAEAQAEYNLMPFRLNLTMDPRHLSRLLLECRNSTLPIEVRQARINPRDDKNSNPESSSTRYTERSPSGGQGVVRHLAKIEISGVLYLIKPPSLEKLGISPTPDGAPADGAPAEGGAPAAAPAPASGETTSATRRADRFALGRMDLKKQVQP